MILFFKRTLRITLLCVIIASCACIAESLAASYFVANELRSHSYLEPAKNGYGIMRRQKDGKTQTLCYKQRNITIPLSSKSSNVLLAKRDDSTIRAYSGAVKPITADMDIKRRWAEGCSKESIEEAIRKYYPNSLPNEPPVILPDLYGFIWTAAASLAAYALLFLPPPHLPTQHSDRNQIQ